MRPVFQSLAACLLAWSVSAVSLDPAFNHGPGTDAFVEQALPLPDDKILICGSFTKYNDSPVLFLARLHEDGRLDNTFSHKINGWVRHMLVQPDGHIVIGGAFSDVDGHSRNLIARLKPDGAVDESFNPGRGFQDKVVASDTNAPYVFWMALQPDGKILVTGSFAKYNGKTVNGLVRLNPDGAIDESFKLGTGLDSWGRFVSVLPNNQILLSGWFTAYNGWRCNRLIRLNPDGTVDTSFRPYFGDKTAIYCAVPLPDGKMLVSGHSKSDFGLFMRGIARLNPDGSEDKTFVATTNERTESLLLQPDGKILASGWFSAANNTARRCLARFHPDGTLDEMFKIQAEFFIWSLVFDAKGRVLAAGGFPRIGGLQRQGVARILLEEEEPLPPAPLVMERSGFNSGRFQTVIPTERSKTYRLEYCDRVGGSWKSLPTVNGTGGPMTLTDPAPAWQRFYRVRENPAQ